MRALFATTAALVVLAALPGNAPAAPLDGSVPMLCAVNSVVECTRRGDCERSTTEDAEVPAFVRIDVGKKLLISVDGSRTSPITTVQRNNGRLMLQGMQNERVWGAVINEQNGQMAATVGEDDGAIILNATCIAP